MIEITAPAMVKVKWLGENKKYITSSEGNFALSKIWPALQEDKKIIPGGVRYAYYEGKWDSLPNFSKLDPITAGIADSSFSFEKLPASSNFGCVFQGFLKIDTEGYYIFGLSSPDGSKLYINDHEIINNDGRHGNDFFKTYVVPLQKGFYPLRIEYFQREGNRRLDIIYLPPGLKETVNLKFNMMYFR
jgi:hypothetical protein